MAADPSYRAPPPGDPRPAPRGLYVLLFAIGLVGYGALAGSRLAHPSDAPHFMLQADAWLHGRVSIDPPVSGDDWAWVETVKLDDDSVVRGRRLRSAQFRTVDGALIPIARLRASVARTAYVSFPPFPTVLMLPGAAIAGRAGNDTIPSLLCAALILPLMLAVLRRLAAAGLSRRRLVDDLWLVGALAFGSVLWFAAVQGEVWFTAHVVGVALALGYAYASIDARHPVTAGLALGAAALTRTAMALMFPLFVLEAWRVTRLASGERDRRALVRILVRFAIPIVAFAVAGMVYNAIRFGRPTEFGHTFLEVRQQTQIERYGLASYHYLSRNLAVAFALLPELPGKAPWIQVSGHGLALWITTPLLVVLAWPRERGPLHRALWVTVIAVALPSLLYQNSGWVQFGYRFSLDYMVFLIMLLAIGGRPIGRAAKALIVVGVVVNLLGAITFNRYRQFYRTNDTAYDSVIAN